MDAGEQKRNKIIKNKWRIVEKTQKYKSYIDLINCKRSYECE